MKLLIVPCSFTDASVPVGQDQLSQLGSFIADWYDTVSLGVVSYDTVTITPVMSVPVTTVDAAVRVPDPTFNGWMTENFIMADPVAILASMGIAAYDYDDHVFVTPRAQASFNGVNISHPTRLKGRWAWLNGNATPWIGVHELGHTRGVGHANTLVIGSWSGSTLVFPPITQMTGGTIRDHEDPTDVMGYSGYPGHFSAPLQQKFSWMVTTIHPQSADASYQLTPRESAGPIRSVTVPVSSTRAYSLEYVQPLAYDATLPSAFMGLHIRMVRPPDAVGGDFGVFQAVLISAGRLSILQAGESFTDGTTRIEYLGSGNVRVYPVGVDLPPDKPTQPLTVQGITFL